MKLHVLPGDALVEDFKKTNIEGELVICRECLIDGDLRAENLEDFWRVREVYLSENYPENDNSYEQNVKKEFEKLFDLSASDEINLWFEYELFCQANMWFCLYLLEKSEAEIYRVEPVTRNSADLWKGFGRLSESDLQKCFDKRKKFSREDISFGADLWRAFQNEDFEQMEKLAQIKSECFPHLAEVCRAAIEKQSHPQETVRKIMADGERDFGEVFRKFNETAGVYGFGDSQVRRIYDETLA